MKKIYAASLCKNGLLGGRLYIDDEKITFCTGKITVPSQLRNLELNFKDVVGIRKEKLFILPIAAIIMRNGEEWKFFILRLNNFMDVVQTYIPDVQ